MNSVITDYTQTTEWKHSKGGVDEIMYTVNTPKYIIKCAHNIGRTCLIWVKNHNAQSLNKKERKLLELQIT